MILGGEPVVRVGRPQADPADPPAAGANSERLLGIGRLVGAVEGADAEMDDPDLEVVRHEGRTPDRSRQPRQAVAAESHPAAATRARTSPARSSMERRHSPASSHSCAATSSVPNGPRSWRSRLSCRATVSGLPAITMFSSR